MTTKKLWLAALAGSALTLPKSVKAETLNFISGDIKAAQLLAAKEGKLVFVDFRANWCAPCKIMEEYIFTHPSVESVMDANYVPVQVDIEDFDGFDLKQKFEVKVLPTMLIFNSQGKLIGKYEESMAASRLIDVLEAHNLPDNKVKGMHSDAEFAPAPPKIKLDKAETAVAATVKESLRKESHATEKSETAAAPPAKPTEYGRKESRVNVEEPNSPSPEEQSKIGGSPIVMPTSGFTIQTGVYAQLAFVKKEVERIKTRLGEHQRIFVYGNTLPDGKQLFKVLVGAFNNKAEAQCYLRVSNAKGIPGLVKSFPELRQQ